MKHLLPILAALCLLAAPAAAQTVKALAYNTTNGQVVYTGTNTLAFTNSLTFGDDVSGTAFESSAGTNSTRFDDAGISFGGSAAATTRVNLGFSTNLNTFWTATNAATARTNLSLGLPALTNTSNVTMMRALAGSTNTNQPYSGTFTIEGSGISVAIDISNGIILNIYNF